MDLKIASKLLDISDNLSEISLSKNGKKTTKTS